MKLGLAAVPFWVLITFAEGETVNAGTVVVAFGLGFSVGVAELFFLGGWLKGLPFLVHLAVKSLAIAAVMWIAFAVLNILDVIIDGITWRAWAQVLVEPQMVVGLVRGVAVIAFLLFFVQLDRLLGPGVLLGYVTGRYHHPRTESRIFMFLDLKGSTTLADEMDASRYFSFLHEYFYGDVRTDPRDRRRDLPVCGRRGEPDLEDEERAGGSELRPGVLPHRRASPGTQ